MNLFFSELKVLPCFFKNLFPLFIADSSPQENPQAKTLEHLDYLQDVLHITNGAYIKSFIKLHFIFKNLHVQ